MRAEQQKIAFCRDYMTGGLNREGFLAESIRLIGEDNMASFAVVFLNVADFRFINESWGEEVGNRTLRFIYRNLKEGLKKDEIACRSGMDHFFVLLHEETDKGISARIEGMIDRFNKQIAEQFDGFRLLFKIGISRIKEEDGCSQAMNRAIRASKLGIGDNSCVFYGGEIEEREQREQKMNELFEESIRNHDFKVYLQPKISFGEDGICCAEALVRWIHPIEGTILPSEFIPLFEKNGKICQLDMYMLEEVCKLIAVWMKKGEPLAKISVNVSRFHLRNIGIEICRNCRNIKEKYQIPDGIIEIELTETALLERNHLNFVQKVLEGFRSCGFEVSLDDFGFAYSSLALLKAFEVDALKLDREFFVDENEKSRKIVAGIIGLAHSLHMRVVAEGIEEPAQVEALREMGCDLIQGYVFSKPLPVSEFEEWRVNAPSLHHLSVR